MGLTVILQNILAVNRHTFVESSRIASSHLKLIEYPIIEILVESGPFPKN